MKPTCYLICGISGSGKTTFAKSFAEKNDLLYFCPDDFYEILHGDASIHENAFDAWFMMLRAIHVAEQNGKSCVIDTNALTKVERCEFLLWFPEFEFHMIYISAEPEVYRRNNQNRRRTIPEAVLADMEKRLEPPTEGEDPRWISVTRYKNTGKEFVPLFAEPSGFPV